MKTITRTVLSAIMLFTMTITAQAENLMDAGRAGFEIEDATSNIGAQGWTSTKSNYFTRTTEEFHSGTASMKLVIPTTADSTLVGVDLKNTKDVIAFAEGDKCKVSCYVYVDGEKCSKLGNVVFALSIGKWVQSAPIVADSIAKDGWVKITSPEITVPETKGFAPFIKINLAEGVTGELVMYIDDVEFSKLESAPLEPEEIEEPSTPSVGFEVATDTVVCGAVGWEVKNDQDFGYYNRSTEKAYHGDASMKVNMPNALESTNNCFLSSTILTPVTVDNTYKVTCWVYIEKVGQLKSIDLISSTMKWQSTTINKANIQTGKWVKLESKEYSPLNGAGEVADGSVNAGIRTNILGAANFTGEDGEIILYLDNVEIVKNGASGLNSTENNIQVLRGHGGITIVDAEPNMPVVVYNLSGIQMASTTIHSEQVFIPLQSGIYILKVGNKTTKVVL